MVEDNGGPLSRAVKIISEIALTPALLENYEECEIISDLLDNEMIALIDDEKLRNIIREMRDLHMEVRRMNYAAYIDMSKEIFGKIPNKNYVLKYHELEQLSKKIIDDDIRKIRDPNLRNILEKVKHVHDNIADKKANVIRRIKIY